MYRLSILFFFLIAPSVVLSQTQNHPKYWQVIVADSITKNGIASASLKLDDRKTFITNGVGATNIEKALFKIGTTVTISCVGYKQVSFSIDSNFRFKDTICMVAHTTDLKQVTVYSHNTQETKIGIISKSYNTHRVPNPGDIFMQYIPNEKKTTGIITTVEYVLNDELHGIEKPFMIQLYSKDKNSIFPDKKLINDSLIVSDTKKRRQFSVDISRYNIQFPQNGVIVVFATLPAAVYGQDSVWYDKEPQGKRWFRKMPGLDMNLKIKDYYPQDHDLLNREEPYGMVWPRADLWQVGNWHDLLFAFPEGNNFAISIIVDPI